MAGEFELNSGQQQVLDHESGSLLVVAGAGTGKTRVIIEKISRLLDDGISPESILAVTFTEKAAAEMLDRLLLSRSGFQLDIPITTFNGYGESLLREFGSHIGLSRNFRLLSEQAQIVFFRERIDEFSLDYFLPLSTIPDAIISDILSYFSKLKQHLVHPEKYTAYASNLPSSDEAEKLEKLKHTELSAAYHKYINLCRLNNVIDYDDQIYLTVELLTKRPNVARQLQDRYQAVFVDEFQDTNPMQSALIDILAGKRQNLVVVGDDDQSIYGFRGATLANILDFKARYPNTAQVALTQNYRSGQKILDAAYSLIVNNNPNRLEPTLGINKKLVSQKSGNQPVLNKFANPAQEANWIAEDIAKRIQAGEQPGHIAVLTRSRSNAAKIHEILEANNIPNRLIGLSQDLYKQPVVRMLIELCRTLAEPHNNNSLHHTLISDLFGIDNTLLAPMAARARHEHELLEQELLESADSNLVQAITIINSLRADSAAVSVRKLIYDAIMQSGYFDRLKARAEQDNDAAVAIQNLGQYFDTLKEFESISNQPTVVEYLVSLPALQAAGEKTDDGTLEITDDQVNVLTVHKSKGLEWNTVYIPFCTDRSFPTQKKSSGIEVPEVLLSQPPSEADEHYAEERRLMYVAVTRARSNLLVSFPENSAGGSKLKPSRFIDEMFGDSAAESAKLSGHADNQLSLLAITESSAPAIVIPVEIYNGSKFYLSVSQASALLDCPLNFYYKFILRAPEEPTPRTAYGSLLHNIFEQINKSLIDGNLGTLPHYLEILEAGWSKSGYESKLQQQKAFAQAKDTVTRFYGNCSQQTPLYAEHSFAADLAPENIVLRGRYDAVLKDEEGGIEIRDYKTSTNVKTADKAKQRATSSNQLTMYALAWQQATGEVPDRLSLHFVDTDFIGTVRKTQRGIDGLRTRLHNALKDALDGKFPAGNKHDYCIHPQVKDF